MSLLKNIVLISLAVAPALYCSDMDLNNKNNTASSSSIDVNRAVLPPLNYISIDEEQRLTINTISQDGRLPSQEKISATLQKYRNIELAAVKKMDPSTFSMEDIGILSAFGDENMQKKR